jgi:hypothetical protein
VEYYLFCQTSLINGGDLGCESSGKAFVNRAGSVNGEHDAPHSSGSRGALEQEIDALVP